MYRARVKERRCVTMVAGEKHGPGTSGFSGMGQ
jgi:hypothetical protein